jgi:hypothetical protein
MEGLSMAEEVTYEKIWGNLSKVSVKGHVEEKMGLSYLSWAWAWGVLMEHYPQAEYRFTEYTVFDGESTAPGLDVMRYHDGSCSVECTITIGSCKRSMWLPVMDHRNNSIANPSSRQVSDTKMRCLVKTIAMFGLGHYLYAGEDLPPSDTDAEEEPKQEEVKKKEGKKKETKDDAVVIALDTLIISESKTVEELNKSWLDNVEELKKIEKSDPDKYKEIVKEFAGRKKELSNG